MTEEERLKQLNDKYDKIYEEKYAGRNLHNEPSPETRERLSTLETTQKFMVQEISEIKSLVKGLDVKLDNVMSCKADKSEVEDLKGKVEKINEDRWRALGVASLGVVVLGTLATLLINHLLK